MCLSWPLWCQESIRSTVYPVYPSCYLDSTGTVVSQNACTETALYQFFLQQADWSKVKDNYGRQALFYLNITKNGELDGYGIRDCADAYLAQRFLEIAESLPLNNWLPCVQTIEPRDAQMMFAIHWSNHQLDSVRIDKLSFPPITTRRQRQIELRSDGSAGFPDGSEALAYYLNAVIELPRDSTLLHKINGGKLSFRLRVERDGSVGKIDFLSSLHPVVDSLVMSALQKGPKWGPGHSNGGHQIRFALLNLVFHPYQQTTGEEIRDFPTSPSFPDGSVALYKFLAQHMSALVRLIPPEEIQEGMFPLQLFVNPDGSVYHARLLKKPHPLIEAGIFAMVKKMPQWNMYRGRMQPKKSIVLIPLRIKQ